MKSLKIIAWCLTTYVCNAQLVEHFDDGNFTLDPAWSGTTSHFIVNTSHQLQLNNSVAGTSYLSTSFSESSLDGFEWEVYAKQSFAGSGSNFGRVYIVSSQSNLAGPLNGYYLQLGEAGSNDAVELFRQSGTVHTSVCRAVNGAIASSFAIRIRVTRSADATWTLFVDLTGGSSFIEAAHGTDASFAASSYLGVLCTYTAGNANKFFFDDFVAGPPLGDLTSPTLQTSQVQSPSSLLLAFSEPLDSVTATREQHYRASAELGHPASAQLQSDQKSVSLTFTNAFSNGKLYDLSVDSVTDVAGNVMLPASATFRHFVPSPTSPGDIVLNEFFADPSPSVGLPSQEFIELLNRSDKAFDLAGWRLSDLTGVATLPSHFLLPGDYLIVTTSAGISNYESHGLTLGLPDLPTLNNASDSFVLKDATGVWVDSVHYALAWYRDEDREQGGYTLERLHPGLDSNEPLNWIASESPLGGTPGQPNSVLGRKLDTHAPEVDSVVVVDERSLRVYFNEAMDSTTVVNLQCYSIEMQGHHPLEIAMGTIDVTLTFDQAFDNGVENYLLIDSVLDLSGNFITPCRLPFRYFVQGEATPGVIRITEIMADPSPVVLLPEAEYVEILNRGGAPLDLEGWKLSDAISVATLPSVIIMPGEYLILSSTSNAPKFGALGKAVSVVGFPSLSNIGEPLVLRRPDFAAVDSVQYNIAWLRDVDKRDGGWSLERLRSDLRSDWDLNWRATTDSTGGTPGKVNSCDGQHPDQEPPNIISLLAVNSRAVNVGFSEPVLFCEGVFNASVDSLQHRNASKISDSIVQLIFDSEFTNGKQYAIEIGGVCDTAMNVMSSVRATFVYFVPQPVLADDVVISEIMADPSPVVGLPEAEYIELLNRSANPIRLTGWQLRDDQTSASLPDAIVLPREPIVIMSALSALKFSPGIRVLSVPGFPSLSNDGEPLSIIDASGAVIDSVNFDERWYHSVEKSDGGWSLEMIDPENPCGEDNNWTASESITGGTPGKVNSVNASRPDIAGPRVEAIIPSTTGLLLTFDEKLSKSSDSEAVIELTPAEGRYAAQFADASLRQMWIEFERPIRRSTEYQLLVRNVRDCNGNEIDAGFGSTKFALAEDPAPGEVVINEVLFNPRTGGVDFVEVLNQGEKYVDVGGWQIVRVEESGLDASVLAAQPVLPPHAYRVFTEDPSALKGQYVLGDERQFYESNLPSMPDDAGMILILDSSGKPIDSVQYSENMHAMMIRDPEGVSLERVSPSTASNDLSNWRSANESAGFATPGIVNSNLRTLSNSDEHEVRVIPEIISIHGPATFAMIEYSLAEQGSYVNCSIVDQRGRVLRHVSQNESVGAQGFFRWEGDNDDGMPVVPGYYFVHFEWFNLDGETGIFRKRVVISPR